MASIKNKVVYTFLNGTCPKVNVISWQEFELSYNDFTV